MVWEMVAQKAAPVFGEEMKRSEKFRFGFSPADAQSSVNQIQQASSLRKHWIGFIQPLRQVKLQETDVAKWVKIMSS